MSRWYRSPGKSPKAERVDGETLVAASWETREVEIHAHDVKTLDTWTWDQGNTDRLVAGTWRRGAWTVEGSLGHSGGAWTVRHNNKPMTTQTFSTADAARHWVEVREVRLSANSGRVSLRGQPPRAGSVASASLPDVRVTPGEREAVNALLSDLGVTYAGFVRGCVRLVTDLNDAARITPVHVDGMTHFVIDRSPEPEHVATNM